MNIRYLIAMVVLVHTRCPRSDSCGQCHCYHLAAGDVWVATRGSNRARKLLHFVQSYFKSVTVSTGGGDNDEDRISISSSIGKCLVAEQDYERAAAVYTELVHMSTSAWGQFHKTTTEYTLALGK